MLRNLLHALGVVLAFSIGGMVAKAAPVEIGLNYSITPGAYIALTGLGTHAPTGPMVTGSNDFSVGNFDILSNSATQPFPVTVLLQTKYGTAPDPVGGGLFLHYDPNPSRVIAFNCYLSTPSGVTPAIGPFYEGGGAISVTNATNVGAYYNLDLHVYFSLGGTELPGSYSCTLVINAQ